MDGGENAAIKSVMVDLGRVENSTVSVVEGLLELVLNTASFAVISTIFFGIIDSSTFSTQEVDSS